jgi:hypothetical protein
MLVRLNQPRQLKAKRQLSLAQVLGPFAEAIEDSEHDLSDVRAVFDWVQYKYSFRDAFVPRAFLDEWGKPRPGVGELAIDLRQVEPEQFVEGFTRAIQRLIDPGPDESRLYLEDFGPGAKSVIWSWNLFFWQHLNQWEQTFSGDYTKALPGGESDGMNPEYVHDQVSGFVARLDELRQHNLLPDEIFVLEMGVGSGMQSKRWMDEFRKQSQNSRSIYYDRLRYIMSDFSQHILDHARPRVQDHLEKVSLIPMNALDPESALGFLRYKVLYVHLCNVYDNLPCTEIARFDGRFFEVETRAFIEQHEVAAISEQYGLDPANISQEIERLLKIGPDYFPSEEQGVRLWSALWRAIRLEERYVPIPDVASYHITDRTTGEDVLDLLREFAGDIRFHLSNGAVTSFLHTIPLLHPKGIFEVQDIFTTDLGQYATSFRGPGKFDGSLANWVNGPLLRHVAGRHGFDVQFTPFKYRKGSQTVILSTTMKE